jgi:hypothetical protein
MQKTLNRLFVLAGVSLALGCSIHVGSEPSKPPPATGGEATAKADEKADKPKAHKPKPEMPKPKPEKEAKPEHKPDRPDKPEVDKPAAKPERPKAEPVEAPAPQPELSKIVLPVKVAIAAIEKELEALVPQTDAKDWTQVTKGDESPKAELKYELWRDPIKVELEGHTFHITVPVRYAATVRAQVKNPLKRKDWIWIAKSETWGTRQDPQRLTARFDAEVRIQDDWQVTSDIKLVKLEHGEPPSGKICKNLGIEVCVPKSSIASGVREGIDKRLEPKLHKALETLDAKVAKAFDLQRRATVVWNALQKPQQLPTMTSAWFVAQPSAIAVGRPELDGKDVSVELAIEGRLSIEPGEKPKLKPVPLPKISQVEGKPGFHVATTLRLPAAVLSAGIERELRGLGFAAKGKSKLAITSVQVIARADSDHPRRIVVKVGLGDEALEVRGDLIYDTDKQLLAVEDVELSASAKELLNGKLDGFDHEALRKMIEAKARWKLGEESAPLRKLIEGALSETLRGQVSIRGELDELDVKKLEMTQDGLAADVIVGGKLELQVSAR